MERAPALLIYCRRRRRSCCVHLGSDGSISGSSRAFFVRKAARVVILNGDSIFRLVPSLEFTAEPERAKLESSRGKREKPDEALKNIPENR